MPVPPREWYYGDPKPTLTGKWRTRRSWTTWFTGRGILQVEVSTELTHMFDEQKKLHKVSWRDATPQERLQLTDPPASLNPAWA